MKQTISRTQHKIENFEAQYGKMEPERLYGKIDDITLVEWEGELEVLEWLEEKLQSLEGITFEYR